jgi:hypothetical protein
MKKRHRKGATVKGNRQLVPALDGSGKPRPGRDSVNPRFSRYLKLLADAGSGLALLSVMVVSPIVVAPASAVHALVDEQHPHATEDEVTGR